jgi:Cu+-exporting ATPase
MHPEIEQDHPGTCPKCGMALEPKTVSSEPEDEGELRDMTRRFWVGAMLALPVFVLAMAHMFPGAPHWFMGDASRWLQFALSTPVVLWAGLPFFVRGWKSLRSGNLNMFTLIAIGVGTAYVYSAFAMLAPNEFPETMPRPLGIYFEAAAVIVVLVLLGQVMELRARSRTGAAVRAFAQSRSGDCARRGEWPGARGAIGTCRSRGVVAGASGRENPGRRRGDRGAINRG